MKRVVIVMTCVVALGGCANGKRLSEIIDPHTMESDQGGSEVTNLRGVQAAGSSPTWTYFKQMETAGAEDAGADQIKSYLSAGITLSDALCSEWFRLLGRAQATVNADRDLLSNVGALSATVLGLANANSAVTGGIAGGFGFLENTMSSEMANFIVAPDVSQVQQNIMLQRVELANDIENSASQINFYQARRALITYDNTCSHLAIKRVVNDSISSANVAKRQRASVQIGGVYLVKVSNELSSLLASSSISPGDLLPLYAYLVSDKGSAPEIGDKLTQYLKDKSILDSNGVLKLKASKDQSVFLSKLIAAGQLGGFENRFGELRALLGVADAAAEPKADDAKDQKPPIKSLGLISPQDYLTPTAAPRPSVSGPNFIMPSVTQ